MLGAIRRPPVRRFFAPSCVRGPCSWQAPSCLSAPRRSLVPTEALDLTFPGERVRNPPAEAPFLPHFERLRKQFPVTGREKHSRGFGGVDKWQGFIFGGTLLWCLRHAACS